MRGKLGWGLVYVSDICEGCQNSVESLLHLFRVCQEIKLLWQFFIRVESGGNFYVCDNWEQWMLENLSKYHLVHGVHRNLLFGIILNIIFENWPVVEVINKAYNLTHAHSCFMFKKLLVQSSTIDVPPSISWKCAQEGEIALNCDC